MLSEPAGQFAAPSKARTWWIFAGLVALALAWRLPHSLLIKGLKGDEIVFSFPTLREIMQGHIPIYACNAAYMAPVQELVTCALFRLFGQSLLTLRLPCVFFAALAVGVSYRTLLRAVPPGAALAVGLLLACGNSAVCTFTSFSYPTWGFGILLVALLQAATLWVERQRSIRRWVALGILCGLSMYIFKLAVIQIGASLLWLFLRSETWLALLGRLRSDTATRRSATRFAICAAAGSLPAIALSYHYLTRAGNFVPGRLDVILAVIAGLLLAGALIQALALLKPAKAAWQCALAVAIATLLAGQPPMLYYAHVVRPQLEAHGEHPWDSARYVLKHFHEWPLQCRLWLESMFPALVLGHVSDLPGGDVEAVALTWRAGLSLALCVLLALGGWLALKKTRDFRPDPIWIFIAPFLLTNALMFPSWNLPSGWAYRYLLPYHAGLLLLVYTACGPRLRQWSMAAVAVVAAYALYCGFDNAHYVPPAEYPRTTDKLIDEGLQLPSVAPKVADTSR